MGCGRAGLACLLVAFAAAGCGGNGPSADNPVASAADRTLDKQTGFFVTRLGGALEGVWAVPGGSGTFSVPDEAMSLTMNCCPGPTDAMTVLEYRMLYPAGYAGYELLDSFPFTHPPRVDKWLKVDLKRPLRTELASLEPIFQLEIPHSPVGGLALLRGSTHAKKLGAEKIDGVPTTHYRVTIDTQEALAKAQPKERAALRLTRLQDGNAAPGQIDVWLGDDGLVLAMRQSVGRNGTMTTNFSHLGSRVHVVAPSADKTVDAH